MQVRLRPDPSLERTRCGTQWSSGVVIRVVSSVLVLLALAACTASGWRTRAADGLGYRYKAGDVDLSAELAAALAKPGAIQSASGDELRVFLPDSGQVYFFTKESNPAHPAMIVAGPDAAGVLPFDGYAGGDLQAFESWLKRIAARRADILAMMRGVP